MHGSFTDKQQDNKVDFEAIKYRNIVHVVKIDFLNAVLFR